MKRLMLSVIAIGMLAGCGGTVQETLGIERQAPDEFQVVRRKPLIIPPDASLRPPTPGVRSAGTNVSSEAKAIVTGADAGGTGPKSLSEQALLAATTVEPVSNIRALILEEGTQRRQIDEDKFLFVLDWQRRAAIDANPLDPLAEADRLEESGIAKKVITNRVGRSQTTGGGS